MAVTENVVQIGTHDAEKSLLVEALLRLCLLVMGVVLCLALASCGTGGSPSGSDVGGGESTQDVGGVRSDASTSSDGSTGVANGGQGGTLTAYFLDVGQGDCEFIQLPDGKTMLIDAGDSHATATVEGFLRGKGVSKLDYVVATHPDEDHIGSLDDVISSFDIGEVWMPNASKDTAAFNDLLNAIEAKGLGVNEAKAGEKIGADGTGYDIAVLGPPEGLQSEDSNDYSVVLKVTYGQTSFLFTGDATAREIVDYAPGHVDVLKAAHHGSETGTNAAVMDALSPSYVVLSYAAGNSYGHPDQSVLDAIANAGATAYSTAANGNIAASSDGTTVTVSATKQGTITAGTSTAEKAREGAKGLASGSQSGSAAGSLEGGATDGSDDARETVYVTARGKKYHRADCRTISGKAVTAMSKQDAIAAGYTACDVCDP